MRTSADLSNTRKNRLHAIRIFLRSLAFFRDWNSTHNLLLEFFAFSLRSIRHCMCLSVCLVLSFFGRLYDIFFSFFCANFVLRSLSNRREQNSAKRKFSTTPAQWENSKQIKPPPGINWKSIEIDWWNPFVVQKFYFDAQKITVSFGSDRISSLFYSSLTTVEMN